MTSFAKNIFTLSVGSLIAQIISVGCMPLITRLYTPDQFGVFSLYLSIVMVIFPVSTLRFNAAIVLPQKDRDAAGLLLLSCMSVSIIAFLVIPFVIWVLSRFGWQGGLIGNLIWMISPGVFLQGIFQSINLWAIRNKHYKYMSVATISESVTDRGLVIGWSFLVGTAPLILIMGRIVGPFISLLFILHKSVLPSLMIIKEAAKWKVLKRVAVRYKDFPLFSSWSFMAIALSRELPTILLAVLFSPVVAGFYGLALRVMNMPLMIVGDSVAKAFLQKAANEKGNIIELELKARKLIIYAVILILPFAIVSVVFGKEIFSWVFGERWLGAGSIVQVLMLVFVCMFLYRIMSVLFDVYEKQRDRLRLDIIMLAARSTPLVLIANIGGTNQQAIALLAIASVVVYLISFRYLFSLVNMNHKELARVLARKLVMFIPFIFIICMLASQFSLNGYVLMVTLALLTAAQYILVIVTDKGLHQYAVKFFRRQCGIN